MAITQSEVIHNEVLPKLLSGLNFRNNSLPAIYAQNRQQQRITYVSQPEKNCTKNLTIFVKTARYNKAAHGKSNRQALREYIKWMRPDLGNEY